MSELTDAQRAALAGVTSGSGAVSAAQFSDATTVGPIGVSNDLVEHLVYEWPVNLDKVAGGAPTSIAATVDFNLVADNGTGANFAGDVRLRVGATVPAVVGGTVRAEAAFGSAAGVLGTKVIGTNTGAAFANPGGTVLVQITVRGRLSTDNVTVNSVHASLG